MLSTIIILFPYGYSQKSSAHSQHCQNSKFCDIDDDVINNIHTYCYALRQSNQKINTSKT